MYMYCAYMYICMMSNTMSIDTCTCTVSACTCTFVGSCLAGNQSFHMHIAGYGKAVGHHKVDP